MNGVGKNCTSSIRGALHRVLRRSPPHLRKGTTMEIPWRSLLFWTPRTLTFLFALFLSLFALDVFGEGNGFWKTLLALFVHLIPTWIVLGVLAISWRSGLIGTLLCFALGTYYLATTWGRFHWSAYVLISGPLFLIGTLFLVDWHFQARLRHE